jgi:hypothetical protein
MRCARRFNARKKSKPGKAGVRYVKSVGLGFKTPREAIEGARQPARRSLRRAGLGLLADPQTRATRSAGASGRTPGRRTLRTRVTR